MLTSSKGGSLAFHHAAAALQHLRGFVGNAPAFFIEVAAFLRQVLPHVGDRFAPLACLLRDEPPGVSARLRCVQECDRRAECRAREEPNQSVRVLLRHTLILALASFGQESSLLGAVSLLNMGSQVTVFRSADETSSEDAKDIQKGLAGKGIQAWVFDDKTPGVPAGAWEVRVAPEHQSEADAFVANFPPTDEDEFADVDPSGNLDEVTVFRSAGNTSEMEAASVQSLLEAGGIPAVVIGDARFPNLGQEVRVPKEHVTEAKRLIADALAVGSAGAEEAEASGESSS